MAARPWSYLPTHSTGQSEGAISSFFFSFAQSLPIVHHSTDQSESDMGVVCGATPHTMVVQQYCCYCPSGAPAACGVPRRTNMTQRHVVHACRVMKRAVFVALLLFARDGIQRGIAPPAPVGRPAGKKSRAGAGKPGPPSQADKRRKIVETKRHDSRWKRWSGVGGRIEQGGSAGGKCWARYGCFVVVYSHDQVVTMVQSSTWYSRTGCTYSYLSLIHI